MSIADATPFSKDDINSYGGVLIGFTTPTLADGQEAPLNLVSWRSGKLDRKCASSLAAEANAMISALAYAEWIFLAAQELSNSAFLPAWHTRRLLDWENGKTHSVHGTLLANASANAELKKHLGVTDAKSLYDVMKQGAGVRSKEPRVTLMAAELRQGISA